MYYNTLYIEWKRIPITLYITFMYGCLCFIHQISEIGISMSHKKNPVKKRGGYPLLIYVHIIVHIFLCINNW